MNRSARRSSITLSFLLVTLAACSASPPPAPPAAAAHDSASTAAAAASPTTPAVASAPAASSLAASESTESEAPTAIPDTAAGIWGAIDAKHAELGTIAANGDLHQVHHLAFAIRDLVAALPAKSTSLNADGQTQLASGVKYVATLAERLDATGDANDRAGTQANVGKLDAVLKSLPRTR